MKIFKSLSQRRLFSRDQGELPDWFRGLFETLPSAVVQPHTVEEAAEAVRTAYQNDTPIVPRGAGSTAFGQVTPVLGGIVLDLSFVKSVRGLDRNDATVIAEAGVRWADLSAYLEERGFALGSYPSSWYSTVGGWIATGGIGMNTLGFGPLKDQVRALWIATREGQIRHLLCGLAEFDAFFETEGQMGIVLAAKLKVRPSPRGSFPVLVPCAGAKEAWELYAAAVDANLGLLHASLFDPTRIHHFNHTLEAKMGRKGSEVKGPFEEKWSVFLYSDDPAAWDKTRAWLADRRVIPAPAFHGTYVWEERFYPLKGKRHDQMFLGNEVRLSNGRGSAYSGELLALCAQAGIHPAIEINAATRKESVVIASFYADYRDPDRYAAQLSLMFRMDRLACVGHGALMYHIGLYNTPFIGRKFDSGRLIGLRAAKTAFDPRGLYNPGKFFDFKSARAQWLPGALQLLGFKLILPLLSSPFGARCLFRLGRRIFPTEGKLPADTGADAVVKTLRECVNCGFCIPVCPAYLATQDERTTARGKLFLAQHWLQGGALTSEDATLLHSCMHCGACTQVCQNALDLVPVWYELESRVAEKHGKPVEPIQEFVHAVESSDDYKRLLRRGFITEPKLAQKLPA